jgi:hypothetical protein
VETPVRRRNQRYKRDKIKEGNVRLQKQESQRGEPERSVGSARYCFCCSYARFSVSEQIDGLKYFLLPYFLHDFTF